MENGDKKAYELAAMLVQETDEPKVVELLGAVEIIHKEGPRAVNLTYPIKKHESAVMFVYQFMATPEKAEEINQQLKLIKESWLLRSLLITPPIKPSRRQERPLEPKEVEVKPSAPAVTNEALEQALKEIL